MPNEDELRILAVAAIDGDGEYCLQRDWNKRWGAEYTNMKNLLPVGSPSPTNGSVGQLSLMPAVWLSRQLNNRAVFCFACQWNRGASQLTVAP